MACCLPGVCRKRRCSPNQTKSLGRKRQHIIGKSIEGTVETNREFSSEKGGEDDGSESADEYQPVPSTGLPPATHTAR